MLLLLLPPLLLTIGLSIFTQSFFLSRTSFDHRSSCEVGSAANLLTSALGLEESHVDFLRREGFLSDSVGYNDNNGCWVPRRVDSMAIIVVDALRFDFVRDHLPLSVGSRLFPSNIPLNNTHDTQTSTIAYSLPSPGESILSTITRRIKTLPLPGDRRINTLPFPGD